MKGSSYFEVRWEHKESGAKDAFVVEISGESAGDTVTAFTRATRETQEESHAANGLRMRIDTPTRMPEGVEIRSQQDYLWGSGELNTDRFGRHLQQRLEGRAIHTFRIRTSVVDGPDLIGRHEKIAEIIERLQTDSCHLRAPRRYGKTSLLRRLSNELPRVLRIDLGHESSVEGLTAAVLYEAREGAQANDALRSVEPLAAFPPVRSSEEAFDEAIKEVIKNNRGRLVPLLMDVLGGLASAGIVLLLDEFALFVRSLFRADEAATRHLLDSLAELRRRPDSPLRLVVAGSTGLSSYIAFHGLQDQLNDLVPIDLEPLPRPVASQLVEELLYGAGVSSCRPTPEVLDRFMRHTGTGVPYFLHALASELVDEAAARGGLDVDAVDRAYNNRLLGSTGSEYFKPFRIEDRPYPDPLRKVARAVLGALARTDQPVPFATLTALPAAEGIEQSGIESLMTCLEEDYDLTSTDDGWTFRCKVLADRWRRFHHAPNPAG